MHDDQLLLNGIDAVTGDYLVAPMSGTEAARLIDDERTSADTKAMLARASGRAAKEHWSVPFDIDPRNVGKAGWAVVFHADEDAAVRKAFDPLVAHRLKGSEPALVRVLDYSGETAEQWLAKYRVAFGAVVVRRVPLYLLLVGSPSRIPFEFGCLLDIDYAVGRLHFDDVAGYSNYIDALIDYETSGAVSTRREIVFFGPRHANDPATWLSADQLVRPLACGTETTPPIVDRVSAVTYRSRYLVPTDSTKEALHGVFHRPANEAPPAVLFTASHGIGWLSPHEDQQTLQGALLCDDFAGPGAEALRPAHYFAASDLEKMARVRGMVCFHFACFGAGTPREDRFFHRTGTAGQLADAPFFAALPKALLGHGNGGALGVISHVDRAWPSSIRTAAGDTPRAAFENTLGNLLSGYPLGYCLNDFNARYAAMSSLLAALLEKKAQGIRVSDDSVWKRWTERNDAEAYVLLGDPAARLRLDLLLD